MRFVLVRGEPVPLGSLVAALLSRTGLVAGNAPAEIEALIAVRGIPEIRVARWQHITIRSKL